VPLRVRSATRATAADGEQSFRGGHRQRVSSTTCSRATSTLRWWTSAPLRPTLVCGHRSVATWFAA